MATSSNLRVLRIIPLLITIYLFSSPAYAKYSGGTGEPNDPYQIATAADLIALGETPEDYDKHVILTADIDLDPNLPGRKVFDKAVIAPDINETNERRRFDGTPFTGIFDGDGHTISHLTIMGVDYLGMFGELVSGPELKNFGVLSAGVVARAVHSAAQGPPSVGGKGDLLRIENPLYTVEFDTGRQAFAIQHKPTQRTFAKNGTFTNSGGDVSVVPVNDKKFGSGQALNIAYPNGSRDRIALYPNLEFVLFTSTLHNGTSTLTVLNKVQMFTAAMDLERLPNDVRVSGSRGNLAAPGSDTDGSFAFLALVDPASRRGAVGGWISHDRGSGVVFTPVSVDRKQAYMKPQIDYGRLQIKPGADATTETFALGWFEDARVGLESYADTIKKVYDIRLPNPPTGLCTWYMEKNQFSCSEAELPKLRDVAAHELKPFGFDFIQLDDGWQAGQSHFSGPRRQFLNVNTSAFPSGMKAAADGIKAAGLMPGIWFMPFAGDSEDPYFAARQDWFVKRAKDAKPYDTYWGGTCLDMTYQPAKDYLRKVVDQLANKWGYTFFKMDGLYTGCGTNITNGNPYFDNLGDGALVDPDKTHIEAYRDGLRLIRNTAGPNVFLLGCTIAQNMRSFGGAFGLVDAMRIGPDTGGEMGAGPGSRLWFLNGRVWWNDPDCVIVRPDKGSLTWARRNATWAAISGQLFYVSDWLPDLPAERMEVLNRCMPSHGLVTARPVDIFDTWMPRIWLLTDTRQQVRRDVVAIYKWWGDQTETISVETARIGLPPAPEYVGFDFWENRFVPPFKDVLSVVLEKDSCCSIAVRPSSTVPQLISTSRHVTQGIVDVTGETWDAAAKKLSGVSVVVGNDPYELRIVVPVAENSLSATEVALSEEDRKAGVTAKFNQYGPKLRVTLASPVSREVRWDIRFASATVAKPVPAGWTRPQPKCRRPRHSWTSAGTSWMRRPTAPRTSGGFSKGRTIRGFGGRPQSNSSAEILNLS